MVFVAFLLPILSLFSPLTFRIEKIGVRYTGVIPKDTKRRIAEARDRFGDNIFLLAETGSWTVVPEDPLVVGFDGDSLWLIDKFDTVSIEALIATEFTR